MPGTAWPIGSPITPVSNLTDALAIAAARKLRLIYIVNPGNAAYGGSVFQIPSDIHTLNLKIIGLGEVPDFLGGIDLNGQNTKYAKFKGLSVAGTGIAGANSYFYAKNCDMGNFFTALTCYGGRWKHCVFYDGLTITGNLDAMDCQLNSVGDAVHITGASEVNFIGLTGDVTLKDITLAAVVTIFGKGLKVTIDASCTAGTINVYGDTKIIDNHAGTCQVNDYTNKPHTERAVNITAIVASETNFLDLETAGFHYTVDDLALKCADPGANSVYVRLYKLVNGVLTAVNVDTTHPNGFVITTVNFDRYWSLNDMFGRDILAGDQIKITVQASAGGPYAVTGSYAPRSA